MSGIGSLANKGNKKMKKLMIAFAAVVLATVANAAAVTWNTGLIKAPASADGTALGTTVFGNVVNSSWTATIYIYAEAACTTLKVQDTASVVVGATTSSRTPSDGASYNAFSGLGKQGANYTDLDYSTTYYYKIMLEGTTADYTASITSANAGSFTTGANATASATAAGSSISGWTTQPYNTVTPVPEPTSALMLLLGMAGLALKRKLV